MLCTRALAIPLPSNEDIAQYKADGRWTQVSNYIEWLHSATKTQLTEDEVLQTVDDKYGQSAPRADLNGDGVADERDVLELGYVEPVGTPVRASVDLDAANRADSLTAVPTADAINGVPTTRTTSLSLPYGTEAQNNQPHCLLLLIKFPDKEPTSLKNQGHASDVTHNAAWAQQKWFDLDAPVSGDLADASVAYYWKSMSYGKLEISGDVFNNPAVCDGNGWITSSETYANVRTGSSSHISVVGDALSQIAPYVNFSDYDSNHDGHLDGLITIYAGADDVLAGGYLWYFRWIDEPGFTTTDGVRVGNGIWQSEQGYLYLFCHEFGHEFGLPDLYDAGGGDSGPDMPGAGMWTLMANWDTNTGVIPPMLDAWSRARLRFVQPIDVLTTGDTAINISRAYNASPNNTVYRLWRNGHFGPEYYLLEYRDTSTGFDQKLPGSGGLMIWHADERRTSANNRANDFDPNRITFEPADFDFSDTSASGDPWRSGFNGGDAVDYFDDTTTPNAKDDSGVNTGVLVQPLSSSGGASMSVRVHNSSGGAPSLSINAPADGAMVSGSAAFTVASNAAAHVEYYVNGCLKYIEQGPGPYSGFTWNTLGAPNGNCVLRAVAVSSGTDNARTVERMVTVNNPQDSGASPSFSDNFNAYSGDTDASLLSNWNLHGDSFGLSLRSLTIEGGHSPCLAFAQSSFAAPPLDGDEEDPNMGVYQGQDDEWLMTPRLNLAHRSGLQLAYKLAFRGAISGENILQTQISDDDGATWNELEGLTSFGSWGALDPQYATGFWDAVGDPFTYFTQRTVGLSSYNNKQVYIRFLYVGGAGYNTGFAMDDFAVTGSAVTLSSATPSRLQVGDSITLTGSGFGSTQGAGEVRFANGSGGYVSQASVTSWSNTQIVCNVPAGAKSDATAGVWVRKGDGVDSTVKPLKVVLAAPSLGGLEQR